MARHKDVNWNLPEGKLNASGGRSHDYDDIKVSVLMDIRDELKRLNALLYCQNFVQIPRTLKTIDKRLAKKVPLR